MGRLLSGAVIAYSIYGSTPSPRFLFEPAEIKRAEKGIAKVHFELPKMCEVHELEWLVDYRGYRIGTGCRNCPLRFINEEPRRKK